MTRWERFKKEHVVDDDPWDDPGGDGRPVATATVLILNVIMVALVVWLFAKH